MRRIQSLTLQVIVFALFFLLSGTQVVRAEMKKGPHVRKMNITGVIAKSEHGYIIRGRKPAMIMTILNHDANKLAAFVESGKEVNLDVHIVSGDNVNIEKINGEPYTPDEKSIKGGAVKNMNLTGVIGKVKHGYVIRGTSKSVIFTVLNPEPVVLDKLVEDGKAVEVTVRIVSGDNVNIQAIEGKDYPQGASGDSSVRMVTLQGEIGKVRHGYVVRGTDKAVIFTVLNPEPAVLDKLADSGQAVEVIVRIVSGDNVNIQAIEGKDYPPAKGNK